MRKIKAVTKPETVLQRRIMDFFILHGWDCWNTHGNVYSAGFPDFYAAHMSYGTRWIEVKMQKIFLYTSTNESVSRILS